MSASEPAVAMRDIRCPKCFSPIRQPWPWKDGTGRLMVEHLFTPRIVICEQHPCDWSGTVIWAEVVEASVEKQHV